MHLKCYEMFQRQFMEFSIVELLVMAASYVANVQSNYKSAASYYDIFL